MVAGTQAQAAGQSVRELEQLRDNCLIAIMQALAQFDYASGRTLVQDQASSG